MEYCEYDEKDLQLIVAAYNFDFQSVEFHMGLDRDDVMQLFSDYDNVADDLQMYGFYDVSDVLLDAFNGFLGKHCPAKRYVEGSLVTVDYYAILSDMTGDYEDIQWGELDEFSEYLRKMYNVFTIGLLFWLDEDQIEFIKSNVVRHNDLPSEIEGIAGGVEFTDEAIMFNMYVPLYVPSPEEDYDYDERKANIHSNLIDRVLQRLSSNVLRSDTLSRIAHEHCRGHNVHTSQC